MTDGSQPRTYRVPPETITERGSAIEAEGAVVGTVFHVEVEGERFMVYEERKPGSGKDLACTCPARRGCEHVAAVMIHMARRLPSFETRGEADQETVQSEGAKWPSDPGVSASFTIPPPSAQPDAGTDSLENDRPRARRIRSLICTIVETLATGGLEQGGKPLRDHVAILEKELHGLAAPDIVRPSSELRTLVQRGSGDPAKVAMLLERLRGVLRVLDAFVNGDGPGLKLEGSYLGRTYAFEEATRGEDCLLLEVARNTVLTPFGLRRNKAWFLDLLTERMYVEQSHERPGDAINPSVGPFPRRIHAGLVMIMPGIPPVPVRLLQYVILPPPGENDLLKLKKASLSSASEAFLALKRTVKMVRAPYPTFVSFAPARVLVEGGMAALADGEGAILRLAHRVDEHACRCVARMALRDRIHCIMGMMVWTGHEVALNPLSVLIEHGKGLSMVRLR